MSRDKQIEEVVKDICSYHKDYGSCDICDKVLDIGDEPCYWKCVARIIIDNDYRKVSDVIDEFAERLIQILQKEGRSNYYLKCTINQIANEMKGAYNA